MYEFFEIYKIFANNNLVDRLINFSFSIPEEVRNTNR